jgi:predicted ABC-type transport system involved in lysophospholipase L1 biosynthesis ATPase subunit
MEGGGIPKQTRASRAMELLQAVGLEGRADHRPNQMSAREQQRVTIARALANEPGAVLADEPAGNLDRDNKPEVMSILRRLNREQGGQSSSLPTTERSQKSRSESSAWPRVESAAREKEDFREQTRGGARVSVFLCVEGLISTRI